MASCVSALDRAAAAPTTTGGGAAAAAGAAATAMGQRRYHHFSRTVIIAVVMLHERVQRNGLCSSSTRIMPCDIYIYTYIYRTCMKWYYEIFRFVYFATQESSVVWFGARGVVTDTSAVLLSEDETSSVGALKSYAVRAVRRESSARGSDTVVGGGEGHAVAAAAAVRDVSRDGQRRHDDPVRKTAVDVGGLGHNNKHAHARTTDQGQCLRKIVAVVVSGVRPR